MGRQITVDEDQLEALIEKKVQEREEARGKGSAEVSTAAVAAAEAVKTIFGISPDGSTREQRIHAELGTPVPERKLHKTMCQPCLNPRNGARFVALVVASKRYPEGRVVSIEQYQYPDDLEARALERGWKRDRVFSKESQLGDYASPDKYGFLPTKMNMPSYLQWRWETYQKADYSAFNGQSAALLPKNGEAYEWHAESEARSLSDASAR